MFKFLAATSLVFFYAYGICNAVVSATGGSSLCDLPMCKCPGNLGKVICDCRTSSNQNQSLTVKTDSHGSLESSFSSISVIHCSEVRIVSRAVENLNALRQITLAHIGNLILEEHALSWNENLRSSNHYGVTINITNVSIPNIPSFSFKGALETIILEDADIKNIQAFGFSSLSNTEKIEFINTTVHSIETQAFKKFNVHSFTVTSGKLMSLPSHSLVDIEVSHEFKFQRVYVGNVSGSAIRIHGPRYFKLTSCRFAQIEENSFRVHTRGPVFIHDNIFDSLGTGAFLEITVERAYLAENGRQEFMFQNNTISNFENGSLYLNTTSFDPKVDWVILDRDCLCTDISTWLSQLVSYNSYNTERTDSLTRIESVTYCSHNKKQTRVKHFQTQYCIPNSPNIYIIIFIICLFFVMFCVIFYISCRYRHRRKRYINVPTSPTKKGLENSSGHNIMVVPEGRTYKETELHVIVEQAEPITQTEYARISSDSITKNT